MKKRTIYLNLRSRYGVETVDEFTQGEDCPSDFRKFRAYVRDMQKNYWDAHMAVYQSSRACKEWRER